MSDKPLKTVDKRNDKGQFAKGNIANPHGRPKSGHAITDILRQLGDTKEQRTKMLSIVYAKALEGDMKAIEFIANYDQGRPVQTVDYTENKLESVIGIVIDKPE